MQNYTNIPETETLGASRAKLLDNDKTVASMFSGASFPTFDLVIDQLCYRTDQKKVYQLTNLTGPVWTVRFDFNGGSTWSGAPLTSTGVATAYAITPSPEVTAYIANQVFWVNFHVASGAAPTLQANGVAVPPNLVRRLGDGTFVNIGPGDIPANHISPVRVLSAAQALVEYLPIAGIGNGGTGATNKAAARAALDAAEIGANTTITSVGPDTTINGKKIGYRDVPQRSTIVDYTLVADDAAMHLLHPSADITARTITIPANTVVPFSIGTAITIVNQNAAGSLTIAITTDTMRLAGQGTLGSRTLAANGIATILKLTATEWIISGTGLS